MGREFKVGDKVKHFKRELTDFNQPDIDPNLYLYEIICFAVDADTLETIVVYKALYKNKDGEYITWARTWEEFMEPVNKEVYPDCKQEYRFELCECGIDK